MEGERAACTARTFSRSSVLGSVLFSTTGLLAARMLQPTLPSEHNPCNEASQTTCPSCTWSERTWKEKEFRKRKKKIEGVKGEVRGTGCRWYLPCGASHYDPLRSSSICIGLRCL